MPLQTRIYLFDEKLKPLSARDVHARMSLTLPSESVPRTIPFQHVVMPAGAAEQDYVVAVFDVRQLPDRDTPIAFEFSGLPNRRHPTAGFNPIFSPAKIRPYVARVLLTEADRDGVMRQRVCPVSGQMLGARDQSSSCTSPTTLCICRAKNASRRSMNRRKNTCRRPLVPSPAEIARIVSLGQGCLRAMPRKGHHLRFIEEKKTALA